jgi:hypothetical protein
MGAAQSIEGATADQLARVGPFKLRSSEKLAVDALSEIVTKLLQKNNLFSLSKILNYPDGCKELFIAVSSTVNKEFQLLKFPEPRSRSSMITLSFIDKDAYSSPSVEGDFTRRKACSEITRFLIRLVTLCAAATASISLNTNLGGVITDVPFESAGSESTLKKDVKNLPDKAFKLGPIDPSILTLLKEWGFVEVDKARPYLLYFNGSSSPIPSVFPISGSGAQFGGGSPDVVIDTRNSVVYAPRGEKSAVFGLKFELPSEQLVQAYERAKRPSAAPAVPGMVAPQPQAYNRYGEYDRRMDNMGRRYEPGAGPGLGPRPDPSRYYDISPGPFPTGQSGTQTYRPDPFARPLGTNITPTSLFPAPTRGAARTRRVKAHRRRTYKRRAAAQSGGATSFLLVTLSEFAYEDVKCRDALNCAKLVFTLDSQGNTLLVSDLERGAGTPSSVSFTARISDQLSKAPETSKIALLTPSVETADDRGKYVKIFEPTPKTYETFQHIVADISGSETGTGPAPYRAYLLASELDPSKTKLTTMFCLDKWAGKWLTSTLGYSLLQSLYNDGLDGEPTSPAAEELQILAKNFIGDKLATEDTRPGEYAKHLGNLKFYPLPAALKTSFCARSGTAPPFTNIPADKDILTAAHQQLRKLYDAHIAAVVDIMKNVLTIRRSRTDASDFRFRLNDKYFKDPRGAVATLEEDIQKMRRLIAKHYFDTEKVYRTALEQLSYTRRGFTPNVVVDTLGRADAALDKEGM